MADVTQTQATLEEMRSYKCLKADISKSLTDLTPVNLQDPSYWEKISYAVKDQIKISAEQAANTDLVVDKSVTAGTYECYAEDLDVDKIKATIDNGNVPLTFKRSIQVELTDGSTQTVYPWAQKWKRIGD